MTADDAPQTAPRVLVSAASKHGATAEIAAHLAEVLRRRELDVTLADPADVDDVDGYDAVVLGSAVYAGHWMKEARELAERIGTSTTRPPVWLFSSGPVGPPRTRDEDPVDVTEVAATTGPRDHRIFGGKIDRSQLGFGERAILVAVRAPDGDDRDWEEMTRWADGIAELLLADAPPRGAA